MSDQSPEPLTILQRLQWRAVLLAFVVDYGGSKFFGLMAGIFAGIAYAKDGAEATAIQQTLLASGNFLTGMLAMGLIFVVIGGYVAASLAPRALPQCRRARRRRYRPWFHRVLRWPARVVSGDRIPSDAALRAPRGLHRQPPGEPRIGGVKARSFAQATACRS